ncbi:MAG: hypothetical protein ACRD3G_10065 [Vicinamibacterales bacterium]
MDKTVFVALILPFTLLIVAIWVTYLERSRRERHRVELQKAVLERVGSVKDFAEFMTTEQGERFLAALAPTHFRPHHRGLWSVRIGVVLLTIGIFLMFALHTTWFGSPAGNSPPPALFLGILLLIAAGAGMLLSAAVSFAIARALGVNGHGGAKKDGAA